MSKSVDFGTKDTFFKRLNQIKNTVQLYDPHAKEKQLEEDLVKIKQQRIYEMYENEKFGEDIIETIRARIKKEKAEKDAEEKLNPKFIESA